MRHGTLSGYTNYRCTCTSCRTAWTEYVKSWRTRIRDLPKPEHIHGTLNGYTNYKCRCIRCVKAHSKYMVEYRMRESHK